jgi:ElaB/YqjD/DUF883 family membrane-anchored ribosome-binding protein
MSVSDIQQTGQDAPVGQRQKSDGATQATKATGRAKEALKAGARRGAAAARTQAAAAGRKVSQIAQERPLTSVSAAVGIGLAAGFLAGVCAGRSAMSRPRGV